MLKKIFKDEDVKVRAISDVQSVDYGRGVGYGILEHVPPADIERVSATAIRNAIANGDDAWKKIVDSAIHEDVVRYLSETKS